MRTVSWVLVLTACLIGRADADVGKAWSAAKDSLPANAEFIAGVDVAAAVKTAWFPSVLDFVRAEERDFDRGHMMIKGACGFDPLTVVDGFVVAGSPKGEQAVFFVQLSIDRQKASACLESTLKLVFGRKGGKQIAVKQDGIYSVASDGGNKALYFAWVAPNVVAFTVNPESKAELAGWVGGKKAFARSAVAAAADKLDTRLAGFGAFSSASGKVFNLPVTKAVATANLANGKFAGSFTMTTTDAGTARGLAADMKKEIDRDLKKDRTPAAVKKVLRAISIQARNDTITVAGTIADRDLAMAITESLAKKEKKSGGSAGSDAAQAVAKMDEFSKMMCGCKDKACADKVNEELTKWGTEMAKKASSNDDAPSPELARKAADIMTRYTECMTKLMMGPGNRP